MGKLTIVQFTFFFAACLMSCTLATTDLSKTLITQMQEQIEMEMQASLFYQTYAHFFESSKQALHGFAKFFYNQSLEEKHHADKLMTYLNKRNAEVKALGNVGGFCKLLKNKNLCAYITLKEKTENIERAPHLAVKNALDFEIQVYDKLVMIAKGGDPQLNHFIEHEFLDEQIESIKMLEDYKTQLTRLQDSYVGLLLMDRWFLEKEKTDKMDKMEL